MYNSFLQLRSLSELKLYALSDNPTVAIYGTKLDLFAAFGYQSDKDPSSL